MGKRNKIETNTNFFSIVKNCIGKLDNEFEIDFSRARYILTEKEERVWLTDTQIIRVLNFTPQLKFSILELLGEFYFLSIGDYLTEIEDSIFTPINLNSSIFTFAVPEFDLKIKPEITTNQIFEFALFSDENKNPIGYDYNNLLSFFPKIMIHKILTSSLPKNNKLEILCFHFILNQERFNTLDFTEITRNLYSKLIFEHSENINVIDILYGYISYNWKHTFLENYRIFERFFKYPKLFEIFEKLELEPMRFQEFLDRTTPLNWKEKEEIAICKLFEFVEPQIKEELKEIKFVILSSKEGEIGKFYYQIRNSIVHNRDKHNTIQLNEEDWKKLINISLQINLRMLNKYQS